MINSRVVLLQVALWGCALGWGHVAPLALVGEKPLSVASTTVQVPLVLVPRDDLTLYSNVHINAVSRTQPLVSCSLNSYTLEATPAVRVFLKQPIVVQNEHALLPFPAQISVLHEGLRMSIPVGALIAPVPVGVEGPQVIRVMYAIPTAPLRLNYPFYGPVPYPFRPDYVDSAYGLKPNRPAGSPARPDKPANQFNELLGNKKPSGPLVTVLDFPSEIASPQTLYYQPPVESELGNRGPPEAVFPAGIVQSAQPRPSLQVFLNSKESPLLQSLRDEANLNKETHSHNSISVEAL
ncbi:uncharacterized protein LOC106667661 [Cimex lectularius]|uniref:Uncharacterized protein n=1 Tax=Cimex lectularius TaxID=79782 RepID=A0A8I6RUS3_CIMLE|nr:uncharacterized protein LOC106667661 [Cimex lectularius]